MPICTEHDSVDCRALCNIAQGCANQETPKLRTNWTLCDFIVRLASKGFFALLRTDGVSANVYVQPLSLVYVLLYVTVLLDLVSSKWFLWVYCPYVCDISWNKLFESLKNRDSSVCPLSWWFRNMQTTCSEVSWTKYMYFNLNSIAVDNKSSLVQVRHQAITWTNDNCSLMNMYVTVPQCLRRDDKDSLISYH